MPTGKDGRITQKTEDIIGNYEIHDFFLYYFIRFGFTPKKLEFLANCAFKGIYDKEVIKNCLNIFISRFFDNQFKRSCMPDGPKVGHIALSPRMDWRMPSDAVKSLWMEW
jgi:NAD+ synthase (glutamine-hydrolysing)